MILMQYSKAYFGLAQQCPVSCSVHEYKIIPTHLNMEFKGKINLSYISAMVMHIY